MSDSTLLEKAIQHHRRGELDTAASLYRQVLASYPDNSDALRLLGLILYNQGQREEALHLMMRAVSLRPHEQVLTYELGTMLEQLGRFEEAMQAYEATIGISPNHPLANMRLGNLHRRQQRYVQAIVYYEQAVASDPHLFEAWNNLGNARKIVGDLTGAASALSKAIELNPHRSESHNNLGMVCSELGEIDRALYCFQQALMRDNRCVSALVNIGTEYLAKGNFAAAQKAYLTAREIDPENATIHSNLLVSYAYDESVSLQDLVSRHVSWGRYHTRDLIPRNRIFGRRRKERIRVGYVSPDFCGHPVAHFIEPVLTHHDRDAFEVFCYSDTPKPDAVTQRLRSQVEKWRDTSTMDLDRFRAQVESDSLDILVDLAGHLARNRLLAFAYRLAPIQMTWLGYPYTTGLQQVDFRITDENINPHEELFQGSEQAIRLRSFCCYRPVVEAPSVSPSPMDKHGVVTFGSLHTLVRLSESVLAQWASLMRKVPQSRLYIFRLAITDWFIGRVREVMQRNGIDPERIIFRNRPEAESHYLSVYKDIDLSLDTFPWSGHTTACESLWMGVPMLTLRGEHYASRMVSSIHLTLGLGEFVCTSPEQFVQTGQAVISSLPKLRATLRERLLSSHLCNGIEFTKELEAQYRNCAEGL